MYTYFGSRKGACKELEAQICRVHQGPCEIQPWILAADFDFDFIAIDSEEKYIQISIVNIFSRP